MTIDAGTQGEAAHLPSNPRCEAIIDLDALARNFDRAQSLAGDRVVYAVIKADAYGHGAVPVARCLARAGCERFAVVSVAEAEDLRAAGIDAPLLVLRGADDEADAERALALDLTPVIHGPEGYALLSAVAGRVGRSLRVHVEVDTGMRRMGVPIASALELLERIGGDSALELEGVFTHFASADDPDAAPSLRQIERFRGVLGEAAERGIQPAIVHADNSAALMTGSELAKALPEANAVRPGLMLYGVNPAPHLEGVASLAPVMTLTAGLSTIRDVSAGESVGYGATHRFDAATRLGTLALGYADGVPVALTNTGEVLVAGRLRPIVGRVSMDYTSIDLGLDEVAPDSRVVIFGDAHHAQVPGASGSRMGKPSETSETGESRDHINRAIRVEAQAVRAGTVSYELLVRVGTRVPRRYVGGE